MKKLGELLREILASIALNTAKYPPPIEAAAGDAVREVNKRIAKLALSHVSSNGLAALLDDMLAEEYRRRIALSYYYLVNELGLSRNDKNNIIK